MYAIDLFCGAGGFSEGILQAGFHIVFSSDKSPYVQETYEARHKQLGLIQGKNTFFKQADIRDLQGEEILESINSLTYFKENNKSFNIGDIDAVFGGPPCQGFSIAGKRDKSDPRNMLFREYLRVIKDTRPKYIVMENVTGFMSMEINPDFKSFNGIVYKNDELVKVVVQKELEAFDYIVLEPRILDASDFGVPQSRYRAFFLAYRKDVTPVEYPNPDLSLKKLTVRDGLAGLSIEGNSEFSLKANSGRTPRFGEKIAVKSEGFHNIEESNHSAVIVERFSLFEQGESVANLKARFLQKLINDEPAIQLDKYPHLKLETCFNINKDQNTLILKKICAELCVGYTDSDFSKMYNKIRILWEEDPQSSIFIKKSKIIIKQLKISNQQFVSIFLECRKSFNKYVTEAQLVDFFNAKNLKVVSLENKNYVSINDDIDIDIDILFNALLTNKNTRSRLSLKKTAPTMLTLPDDFIHPVLNKMLNVREMARLQSFDDSFIFFGKRTTGGKKRGEEIPQFTQVGNAVPPLLAYAIANEVKKSVELNLIHESSNDFMFLHE